MQRKFMRKVGAAITDVGKNSFTLPRHADGCRHPTR